MLRCIVIDDEPLALNILTDYINKTDNLLLVDITTQPLQGLQRIQNNEADVVFLDINMPGINGLQAMDIIGRQCRVILTTAYAEFAVQGFDREVVDYLLKPVSYERFCKAVKKLEQQTGGTAAGTEKQYFFVKSEYKQIRIDYADVLYFESLRDYVAIHLTNNNKILTLQSLSSFEKELPPLLFVRIHKSYIISLSKIKLIEKSSVSVNGKMLPVGNTFRAGFEKALG
jgi:two-component system, LytTR family, response regulator